jgi:NADH-quinone oxidoreductase subunit I
MEQPPHPMRLGDNEQDYYVQGPEMARKGLEQAGEHDLDVDNRAGANALPGAALVGRDVGEKTGDAR